MADNDPTQDQDDTRALDESAGSDADTSVNQTEDMLDKLPPESRQAFLRMFASMTSTRISVGSSLLNRLTDEHLDSILSTRREEIQLAYKDRSIFRFLLTGFAVFVVLVAVGFSVFLANREMDALLIDLFTKVIIALGGFGAGWGASRFRR